ncbi:MAG: hypothetical protein ACYDHX_17425 [Methanothrix sp.]
MRILALVLMGLLLAANAGMCVGAASHVYNLTVNNTAYNILNQTLNQTPTASELAYLDALDREIKAQERLADISQEHNDYYNRTSHHYNTSMFMSQGYFDPEQQKAATESMRRAERQWAAGVS